MAKCATLSPLNWQCKEKFGNTVQNHENACTYWDRDKHNYSLMLGTAAESQQQSE